MACIWLKAGLRFADMAGLHHCTADIDTSVLNDGNGTKAPDQHTAKQSLDDHQIPVAALRCTADRWGSSLAMTALGRSSRWLCGIDRPQAAWNRLSNAYFCFAAVTASRSCSMKDWCWSSSSLSRSLREVLTHLEVTARLSLSIKQN